MIKIQPSGDYVQLIYVDVISESVQEELKSDTDAVECSFDSEGKLYLQFGRMTFEVNDPTIFQINGSNVTDAADFITKLNALFTGGGGSSSFLPTTGTGTATGDITGDLNGKKLNVTESGYPFSFLTLDPTDGAWGANIGASADVGDGAYAQFQGLISESIGVVDNAQAFFGVEVTGIASVNIIALYNTGNPGTDLTYTADTHTFNGVIVTADIIALDFANDGAAASGGVAVGQWYHTSGTLKIRLS